MKKNLARLLTLIFLILILVGGVLALTFSMSSSPADGISVKKAYAFATAPGVKTGAVFMFITNNAEETDSLIKASSDITETVEIHDMSMSNGVMQMREIERIELEPGSKEILEPTGRHIMLIGLKEQLTEGQKFPLTLTFENAESQTFDVKVVPAGHASDHHH